MKYILWKIYFWILTIIFLCVFPLSLITEPNLKNYIDGSFSLVGLLGVYGFAYQKKILHPTFWKIGVFIILAWDIFLNLYVTDWSLEGEYLNRGFMVASLIIVSLTLTFALFLLGYIALYLYGFKSPNIWYSSQKTNALFTHETREVQK